MYDLVIRNGAVIDGTGADRFHADVAVKGGKIVAVGARLGAGAREIDAAGRLVTPGIVDVHTHYDAQVTWDPWLSPSSAHGVTTVVMGNCGVGFAPVAPDRHEWLIRLMEGVEDIPGAALAEGIRWGWESFPQYMDVLDSQPRALDFAVQIPHGALRAYVMGERGARNEEASPDDISRMAALVREAVEAGALGFSTSRTPIHRSADGELVPGTTAGADELLGIGRALTAGAGALFQMTTHHATLESEFPWMERLSTETGVPVSFNLVQIDEAPQLWRRLLKRAQDANASGANLIPQIAARPAGILMSWHGSANPFVPYPSWKWLAALTPQERLERLRDPQVRAKVLAETPADLGAFYNYIARGFHKMFPLGDPPDYEPGPERSVAAIAARTGRDPRDVAWDLMLEGDGRGVLYFPIFNYSSGDMSALHELLSSPITRVGLGDGGAHCATICDASIPTFMLTHWTQHRSRGPRLTTEWVIHKQTRQTAQMYGLLDRGLVAPGYRADLNVIDPEALRLEAPHMVWDLPAGGRRFVQGAGGYVATVVAGEVIMENGAPTGALPGRLIRGRRADPTL